MNKRTISEIIIGILALLSIILLAVESIVTVTENTLKAIYIADLIICFIFACDFINRLKSYQNKRSFWKTDGFEILAMIPALLLVPLGAIPFISSGLRSLRLIRVIRVILILGRMRRALRTFKGFVKKSYLVTMILVTFGIIFMGGFAVLILESEFASSQITTFSDALWWSISTVTTVGYGDIVPMSVAGRVMGMILMIVGIGVMAAFISEFSATLVESRMKNYVKKDDLRSLLITDIKSNIDNIDNLSDNEVSLLIQMIRALRGKGELS